MFKIWSTLPIIALKRTPKDTITKVAWPSNASGPKKTAHTLLVELKQPQLELTELLLIG